MTEPSFGGPVNVWGSFLVRGLFAVQFGDHFWSRDHLITGRDHLQACTGLFNPVNLVPCLLKREEAVFVFNTINETK